MATSHIYYSPIETNNALEGKTVDAATMTHEGATITSCSARTGEISYSVIFSANADSSVSIVAGVLNVSTMECLASNATTYLGDKVYVS